MPDIMEIAPVRGSLWGPWPQTSRMLIEFDFFIFNVTFLDFLANPTLSHLHFDKRAVNQLSYLTDRIQRGTAKS